MCRHQPKDTLLRRTPPFCLTSAEFRYNSSPAFLFSMFCRVRPLHSQQRPSRVPGMTQKTELISIVKFDWTYPFYQITPFAQVAVAKWPKNHSFWSAPASFLYLIATLLLYSFSLLWWRFGTICPVENFLALFSLNPRYYPACKNSGLFWPYPFYFIGKFYLFCLLRWISFSGIFCGIIFSQLLLNPHLPHLQPTKNCYERILSFFAHDVIFSQFFHARHRPL